LRKIFAGQAFTLALVAVLLLAYWFPEHGVSGGALRTEVTTPLAVVVIFFLQGLNLSGVAMKRGFSSWKVQLFAHSFGFFLMPLVAWACVSNGWVSPGLAPGLLFLSILPTTISTSVVYSDASGGDAAASTFCAASSNLLAIFLVPALASWLIFPQLEGNLSGQDAGGLGFYTHFLERLVWLIALPMLVGLLARRFLASLIEHRGVFLRNASFCCVLFIAYAGFCKGFREGDDSLSDGFFVEAVLWVLALLAFANFSALFLLKFFRFSWPQVISCFFASTQKSLAVGLPMGYLLFGQENPRLFAILLPLVLFHPLQLLLGASLCSLLPKNSSRT
tara:strand:+ start:1688 stop:2689 length:1002 start_codon:yes stop_codon:yes gene_type:complete